MTKKHRICWITATYFLDVDLPIVPKLMEHFDIDWKIITTEKMKLSDRTYIESQTNKPFDIIVNNNKFYSYRQFLFYQKLIKKIKQDSYDWIYFDISDLFFLFPLIKHYLGTKNITVALHNVSVPKGARLAFFARISNSFIVRNFINFQVFSNNQLQELRRRSNKASIFYCPLMLKDYGNRGNREAAETTRFLYFGNIIPYKRVDILIEAVNRLVENGVTEFKVSICGYCRPDIWESKYAPLIKYPAYIECDIRRIPNELVSTYFNRNDYFVMPYQDIAQSGAMTVALNYNMPIIASDLDTFKEFITHEENGYLFNQGDVEALAEAMRWAIHNNREEYKKLKEALQKMVDTNLSEEVIIKKYTDYLRVCLR